MSGGAGLNPDQAGWQRLEEAEHLGSPELLAESDSSRHSHSVNLKHVLRHIEPDDRYLIHLLVP